MTTICDKFRNILLFLQFSRAKIVNLNFVPINDQVAAS